MKIINVLLLVLSIGLVGNAVAENQVGSDISQNDQNDYFKKVQMSREDFRKFNSNLRRSNKKLSKAIKKNKRTEANDEANTVVKNVMPDISNEDLKNAEDLNNIKDMNNDPTIIAANIRAEIEALEAEAEEIKKKLEDNLAKLNIKTNSLTTMDTTHTSSPSMMSNTHSFRPLTPTRTLMSGNVPRVTTVPNTDQGIQTPTSDTVDLDALQKFIEQQKANNINSVNVEDISKLATNPQNSNNVLESMRNQVNNLSGGNNIQSALPTNSNISPSNNSEELEKLNNKFDLDDIRNNIQQTVKTDTNENNENENVVENENKNESIPNIPDGTRRADLGAIQNRLEHTIKNLGVTDDSNAAESNIRDTDMASEMVKYKNNQILQNAGQAMLSQANNSTNAVLSLLN